MKNTNKMTFDELAKIEPRLADLKADITKRMGEIPKRSWVKRDQIWYEEFKPRMCKLVGFGAYKPELQNCDAYDLVYHTFIEIIGC